MQRTLSLSCVRDLVKSLSNAALCKVISTLATAAFTSHHKLHQLMKWAKTVVMKLSTPPQKIGAGAQSCHFTWMKASQASSASLGEVSFDRDAE